MNHARYRVHHAVLLAAIMAAILCAVCGESAFAQDQAGPKPTPTPPPCLKASNEIFPSPDQLTLTKGSTATLVIALKPTGAAPQVAVEDSTIASVDAPSGNGPYSVKVTGIRFGETAVLIKSAAAEARTCVTVKEKGLTLSTGVGFAPASGSTTYVLNPNPSSTSSKIVSFSDQSTNPALSLVIFANFPIVRSQLVWGTVGTGTNKTDLVAGLSYGTTSFVTIGLRQISTQQLLPNYVIGSIVPQSTNISSITYTKHSTRLFLSYSVDASVLGCVLTIFQTTSSGCSTK